MKLRNPWIVGAVLAATVIGPMAFAAPKDPKKPGPPASSASASAQASASAAPASSTTTTSTTTASATPTAAGPAASVGLDGRTYAVRLRELEQRVESLKQKIRTSHTKLAMLSDSVMSSSSAGSRAEISFQNEMSSTFKLVKLLIVLDGSVQTNKSDDTGALADQKSIPVFTGSIPPGDHSVSILAEFKGNGHGVFTYLNGYKFELRSNHAFGAVEGKTLTLNIIAYEKGDATTDISERPTIRYGKNYQTGISGAKPNTTAPAPAPSTPGAAPGAGK